MSKVAIVTDSTAYIPADLIKQYNLGVAPLELIWGDETFRDGVDIQPEEFYARLKTAKVMPTTSQATIPVMLEKFTQLVDAGYEVLGIFISSRLSGTVSSATQAIEMMKTGKEKIAVVDSLTTAMAMGFQVLAAARAANDGATLADCRKVAENARAHTGVYFAVDTLEFLHRGGRINSAARFLGSALNLKPILAVLDGKVEAIDRVRTKAKALDRVVELVAEKVDGNKPLRLATLHVNAKDEAGDLLDRAAALLGASEKILTDVSPVIGTHAGPGTVGLAYMAGM